MLLYWRVYLHHTNVTPFIDDDRVMVRLGRKNFSNLRWLQSLAIEIRYNPGIARC